MLRSWSVDRGSDLPWAQRSASLNVGRWLALALLLAVAVLLLVLLGGMTALAPEFMAKVAVLPLAGVALLVAMLARSTREVTESTRKLWLTFLLAALALWPSYLLIKSGGLPALDGRRFVVGCCLLMGVYLFVSRTPVLAQARQLRGPVVVGAWLVGAYAVWRLLSCLASPAPIYSLVQVIWDTFYYFSLYFLGYLFFSTEALRQHAHRVILWLILLLTAFACAERVAQENFLIRFAPHNEEFSSLVRSMTSARFREGGFRAQATFEHPLLLAEFSAIAAAFATASLVWSSSRPGLRCLGAVALFGAILTGLLTGSRSAYIALGLSIGTVLVLRVFGNRRPRLPDSTVPLRRVGVAIVAALGLVVALVALPHLARGGSVGDQASSEGRLLMVRAGLPSIERSPFFGEGPGAGASLAGLKVRSDMVTLDNYLLAITLESGVPALLLLVAALAYPVWQAYLSITRRSGADSAFVAAVAGALLAILAMRIILWMPYNMSFGFLFAAMALAACAVQAPRGLGR